MKYLKVYMNLGTKTLHTQAQFKITYVSLAIGAAMNQPQALFN